MDVLSIRDEAEIESSACKFEHILSPDVTDRICTLLGHPLACPHLASPLNVRHKPSDLRSRSPPMVRLPAHAVRSSSLHRGWQRTGRVPAGSIPLTCRMPCAGSSSRPARWSRQFWRFPEQVLFHCARTDMKTSGNFLVAASLRQESQNLFVARGNFDGIQIDHCVTRFGRNFNERAFAEATLSPNLCPSQHWDEHY